MRVEGDYSPKCLEEVYSRRFICKILHRSDPVAGSGARSSDPALVALSQDIGVMSKDAE